MTTSPYHNELNEQYRRQYGEDTEERANRIYSSKGIYRMLGQPENPYLLKKKDRPKTLMFCVRSQTQSRTSKLSYSVDIDSSDETDVICDCKAYQYYGSNECKHIIAVKKLLTELKQTAKELSQKKKKGLTPLQHEMNVLESQHHKTFF